MGGLHSSPEEDVMAREEARVTGQSSGPPRWSARSRWHAVFPRSARR
jgi:hypothetical protein